MSEILKVAIGEPFKSDYMDMPTGDMYWLGHESSAYDTEGKTFHGKHVYETIVNYITEHRPEFLDRFDVDLMPNVKTGLLYSRANGYKIFNLSNKYIRSQDPNLAEIEKDISKDMLLICSAGNDGDGGESDVSLREHWLSVGAVDKFGNPKYYSSYGDSAVDVVGISGIPHEGTSFSAPYVTAIAIIYYIEYYDRFGDWPSSELARKFLVANAHDVWDSSNELTGWDIKTGFGLVCLPDLFTDEVLKVLVPSNPRILMEMIDDRGRTRRANIDIYDKERIRMHQKKGFYKTGYYNNI